jgi:segregation and condensation protein A
MSIDSSLHHAGSYRVNTPLYEGPLDLLLQLIERAELDITKLALAQVTDQFLAHLRQMEQGHAEEVSAFLVIAAKLIQIKSEVLLPRPPAREPGEEDVGEALALQLIQYKKFKEIANLLGWRESANLRTYLRIAPAPRSDVHFHLNGITLDELIAAVQAAAMPDDQRQSLDSVVTPLRITIREKISHITTWIKGAERVAFHELLSHYPTTLEIVVTFLAMLELIKRQVITVNQDALFGEIFLEPQGIWEENEDFELEFGE